MSDTPRTDAAYAASTGVGIYELFKEAQDIERELNAANERIRLLISERDTARRQADQNWKLREEFTELLGTDDVEKGVAVVREMKEHIKRLESVVNDPHALWANWLRGTVALPAGIGDVRQYQERIKRLEEALSKIAYAASHPLGSGQSLTLGKIEEIALKAKEAKP